MHSPLAALTWDIWQRNRKSVWLALGIFLLAGLANMLLPETAGTNREWVKALIVTFGFIGVLIVFGIFSYTELNPQNESIGFPHRLFVLPVTTLQLVTLPMSLGIVAVEVVFLAWNGVAFPQGDRTSLELSAVLIGSYMVFYQTTLWTLSGLRSMRMVVLGLLAIFLIVLGFVPSFPDPPFSANTLMASMVGLAFASFLVAWSVVAGQRCGAGSFRIRQPALIQRSMDAMPRRTKPFRSAADAQFWFEWRRSGLLLPLMVGALLLVIIGPLSWTMKDDPASTLRILIAALAMPVVLAAPVGKGFSKPDFWSTDLTFPAFLAVRPLATDEMIFVKMKVAARSAIAAWALVLGFLSLWLPLWANLESVAPLQRYVSHIFGYSSVLQYSVTALTVVAGIILTWRFLVSGLWIGLSGNRRLFIASALPYGLAPVILIVLTFLLRSESSLRIWIRANPDRFLQWLVWIAILAVAAKLALASFSWRKSAPQLARRYWLTWSICTVCMIALAFMLWGSFQDVLSVESLVPMILAALLLVPLARPGIAQIFMAKNRHQ